MADPLEGSRDLLAAQLPGNVKKRPNRRSIAAMAGASASAAAAAAQRAVIEAAKKRQSLANLDEGHAYPVKLESEISNEEAEGLFT